MQIAALVGAIEEAWKTKNKTKSGGAKMTHTELIKKIESKGKYCKVRIDKNGEITGMLVDENYRYKPRTNTGGRRYLGHSNDVNLHHIID